MDIVKKCTACNKIKSIECFGFNKVKPTQRTAKCDVCKSYQTKWDTGPKGKAFSAKRRSDPVYKAKKLKDAQKPERKLKQRAAAAILEATGKYKARREAYRDSEQGRLVAKANNKKQAKVWKMRYKEDPCRRLEWAMRVRINKMLLGSIENSKTVFSNSEFLSREDVVSHFKTFMKDGMTLENYGSVWHIEHSVPCCWYDHQDPEDVMRCWSKSNLTAMFKKLNLQKSYKIIPEIVIRVPVQFWPKSWNGVLPSESERRAMYKSLKALV